MSLFNLNLGILGDWTTGIFILTGLELILGIDNIIFISILIERIPQKLQKKVRIIGLSLAVIFRLILLLIVKWLSHLDTVLFAISKHSFSLRDIILILGGLFLIYKSTNEIFNFIELKEDHKVPLKSKMNTFYSIIFQIVLFDLIFSLDSILTAIGLAKNFIIMVIAIILSTTLIIIFSNKVSKFVSENPTLKILALSFLTMIGILLMAEGWGSYFQKSYIYFAMFFSLTLEFLNKRRLRNYGKIQNKD